MAKTDVKKVLRKGQGARGVGLDAVKAIYQDEEETDFTMTTILIIIAVLIAAYLFAAVTFYYGFKNWRPMCGGSKPTTLRMKGASSNEIPGINERR